MGKLFFWIKTHKFVTFLLLIIFFFVFKPLSLLSSSAGSSTSNEFYGISDAVPSSKMMAVPSYGVAPQPEITDRKVITNSNFSLLVKNVTDSATQIKQKTVALAGYVISTNINRSQYGDTATVEIRIPTDKTDEITTYLRNLAVKVVSENVSGRDITDQYVDIQERINQLSTQKAKMQEIMNNAKTVAEMLEVQQALFNVQNQIDSYKGQLAYMDGASSTTRLSIAISTDELSLPYSPAQPWKPEAIFKQAVRGLLGTLQFLGTIGIWIAVFSPLLLIAYLVYRFIRRKRAVVVR